LLESMREARCIRLDVPTPTRVAMLACDYAHLASNPAAFTAQLAPLGRLHGNAVLARWQAMLESGAVHELATELLDVHYDPSYERAIARNFAHYRGAEVLRVDDAADTAFRRLARQLLAAAPLGPAQ
jgi:tRNA 2-selenouridine synthase